MDRPTPNVDLLAILDRIEGRLERLSALIADKASQVALDQLEHRLRCLEGTCVVESSPEIHRLNKVEAMLSRIDRKMHADTTAAERVEAALIRAQNDNSRRFTQRERIAGLFFAALATVTPWIIILVGITSAP